jgi:hypothetical protein
MVRRTLSLYKHKPSVRSLSVMRCGVTRVGAVQIVIILGSTSGQGAYFVVVSSGDFRFNGVRGHADRLFWRRRDPWLWRIDKPTARAAMIGDRGSGTDLQRRFRRLIMNGAGADICIVQSRFSVSIGLGTRFIPPFPPIWQPISVVMWRLPTSSEQRAGSC